LTLSFRPHYGPGVDSASNSNEYQVYFLGVKAVGTNGLLPYHLHVVTVFKSGSLSLLGASVPVQAINVIALPYVLRMLLEQIIYIENLYASELFL
jgi:hypothetical protein